MRQYPIPAFANVNVTSPKERLAYIRGFLTALAWVNGIEPADPDNPRTPYGCETASSDALHDAMMIASSDAAHRDTGRVEHCLTTARYAVQQSARDAVHATIL